MVVGIRIITKKRWEFKLLMICVAQSVNFNKAPLLLLRRLHLVINTSCCHELLMITMLDDITIYHDEDDVSILNSRQAVGDDKASPSHHELAESLLNQNFCSGINRGSRLVQD